MESMVISSDSSMSASDDERPNEDTQTSEVQHPWPHLASFIGPVIKITSEKQREKNANLKKGKIRCKVCKKVLSFSTDSLFNLKAHYKTKHNHKLEEFETAISGGSKRGKTRSAKEDPKAKSMRQMTIGSGFSNFNPKTAEKLFQEFMVEEMMPASLTESTSFRKWVDYIKCSSSYKLPSRKSFMTSLNERYRSSQSAVTSELAKVKYVSTTADCWTAHNRSFLGMTVHWIDPNDLTRKNAVLCCKELQCSHTHDVLAAEIDEMHEEFGLVYKVVSTTTDNGANFVKAFRVFGPANHESVPIELNDRNDDVEDTAASDVDDDPVDICYNEIAPVFESCQLPNHFRCASHTLNLLATKDIEKVPGWSTGLHPCFRKTMSKAQALWNRQNRKPVAAAAIKKRLGRKLTTPCATRWNSVYDSVSVLHSLLKENQRDLNNICLKEELSTFTSQDMEIMDEFLICLKPVAAALDKLQSEKDAYMGILLPTLHVLKTKLENLKRSNLQYADRLVHFLLGGFEKRFRPMFEDDKLLKATATHPSFRLGVIHHLNGIKLAVVKDHLVREVTSMVASVEELVVEESTKEKDTDVDDYFKELRAPPVETRLSSKLEKELVSWNAESFSGPITASMFPSLHQKAWVRLFLKYNSAVPSSAAVERLFSTGSDILRKKRSSLSSKNFEMFLVLKKNSSFIS